MSSGIAGELAMLQFLLTKERLDTMGPRNLALTRHRRYAHSVRGSNTANNKIAAHTSECVRFLTHGMTFLILRYIRLSQQMRAWKCSSKRCRGKVLPSVAIFCCAATYPKKWINIGRAAQPGAALPYDVSDRFLQSNGCLFVVIRGSRPQIKLPRKVNIDFSWGCQVGFTKDVLGGSAVIREGRG
jgi:hypothetical protein